MDGTATGAGIAGVGGTIGAIGGLNGRGGIDRGGSVVGLDIGNARLALPGHSRGPAGAGLAATGAAGAGEKLGAFRGPKIRLNTPCRFPLSSGTWSGASEAGAGAGLSRPKSRLVSERRRAKS